MSAHLDDETLSAVADGAETHPHVAQCSECRARVQQFQSLSALLEVDEDVAPSPGFEARVFAQIAAERPRRFWVEWLAPAFGAAMAIVVALTIDRTPHPDELFIAENQEMLAEMDMLTMLDGVEDFETIAEMGEKP